MPSECPERRRCRRDGLAFKLRRKALRWFIDSRCACRTAFTWAHRAVAGKPLIEALSGCASKGRYERGDDNGWSHGFEISTGPRRLRRCGCLGSSQSAVPAHGPGAGRRPAHRHRRGSHDLRVRLRGLRRGADSSRDRFSRKRFGIRPVAQRHRARAAGQAGRRQRRGHAGRVELRKCTFLAAHHGGRGLSDAAHPARRDRSGVLRAVRRGHRPGRGRGGPRRHAAHADRYPGRDLRREGGFGRHRPVPPRCAGAHLVHRCGRRRGCRVGPRQDVVRSSQGRR